MAIHNFEVQIFIFVDDDRRYFSEPNEAERMLLKTTRLKAACIGFESCGLKVLWSKRDLNPKTRLAVVYFVYFHLQCAYCLRRTAVSWFVWKERECLEKSSDSSILNTLPSEVQSGAKIWTLNPHFVHCPRETVFSCRFRKF